MNHHCMADVVEGGELHDGQSFFFIPAWSNARRMMKKDY
jgi:hypothetical protein